MKRNELVMDEIRDEIRDEIVVDEIRSGQLSSSGLNPILWFPIERMNFPFRYLTTIYSLWTVLV